MELWDIFPFIKDKVDHKVLIFGSKYSKLSNHVKYKSNKKVESVVNIHVGN